MKRSKLALVETVVSLPLDHCLLLSLNGGVAVEAQPIVSLNLSHCPALQSCI